MTLVYYVACWLTNYFLALIFINEVNLHDDLSLKELF